jgi:hypothetical protein
MSRIPDEVLEYYADLFIELRIRERGITFERFLDLPDVYLTRRSGASGDRRLLACLVAAAAVLVSSCGRASDAEATASQFIDRYYVKVDLARAKEFTGGLATRKIDQEQALLQGTSGDPGTRRRDVAYHLVEKRSEGARLILVYDIDIRGQGVPVLRKRSLISVEKLGAEWRVMNFHDFDS